MSLTQPIAKPVSRQRLYQLRQRAKGCCILCGNPATTKTHCNAHAKDHNERNAKRRAKLNEAANIEGN